VVRIFTVGHSTHPIGEFIALLRAHGVGAVADVRTIPKSAHNPQFGEQELGGSLAAAGLGYRRLADLGGLRHGRKDSPNGAWRNASFRGYADYMQTDGFAAGLAELLEFAAAQPTAIMCAEAVPWRCHRSLIGDALVVRGVEVLDIMSPASAKAQTLTSFARVTGETLSYPPDDGPDGGAAPDA
jgi:uncharacterized protein (DUF488 family)